MIEDSNTPISPHTEAAVTAESETDAEFLARLKRLGRNWRYSDEFIGMIVRSRYPRDYSDVGATP